MTPLQFEQSHRADWAELEAALSRLERGRKIKAFKKMGDAPLAAIDGARVAALYRRSCEHLALAQARAYPIHLTHRLEMLTQRGHRIIYRRDDHGASRFKQLVLVDFPQSVRAHRWYLLAATLLFLLPMLTVGWASYRDPGFVLHMMDADQVQNFDSMYGDKENAIGHLRRASTDWHMFGFYIQNNISIGFQCFASGLFWGVGSLFYLVFNGQSMGAVAGYLTARGYSETFYSFVVTHSAFELTAIVLCGAAGLRLGHALLSPGRHTRIESLKLASKDAITVVYGAIGLLLIAAAVEAFWSSARWVAPGVKYGVGAVCWTLVIAYLGWQGRPRSPRAN